MHSVPGRQPRDAHIGSDDLSPVAQTERCTMFDDEYSEQTLMRYSAVYQNAFVSRIKSGI
jgi:hypothetical protein